MNKGIFKDQAKKALEKCDVLKNSDGTVDIVGDLISP